MAIPFILGGAAALSGAYGVKKHIDASDNFNRAESINNEAKEISDTATKTFNTAREFTNSTIENLGEKKIEIMGGNVKNFVDIFSKIKNVNFNDSVGMEELRAFTPQSESLNELRKASYNAADLIKDGFGGMAGGALAAAGAYGAVGAFASASTGAAISGLSGAAATNATLAWLGGGAKVAGGFGMFGGGVVLGGVIVGPFLAIWGSSRNAKAEAALNDARTNMDKARKYAQEARNICSVLSAVAERADQIKTVLIELDKKLSVAVTEVKTVIELFGTDWKTYSRPAKEKVGIASQLAKTIKAVIDTSLLTEDGKLSPQSQKVFELSQPVLGKTFVNSLRESESLSDPQEIYQKANNYYYGWNGCSKNENKALTLFKKAANAGHEGAQRQINKIWGKSY